MHEIDLRTFFRIIWKRAWIVLVLAVLLAAVSGYVSWYILKPEYQTYTTMLIGRPQNYNQQIQYSDVQLNESLITTYREIVKSKLVLEQLVKSKKLSCSYEEVKKKINVTLVNDTEIIMIKVNDSDPLRAAGIANEITKIFKGYVSRIMKIDNVQVIDAAGVPVLPVKPRPVFNMIIAGVLGVLLGILLILLLEYLDNTIKTQEDAEKYLNLPVIGMIPKVPAGC